MNELDELLLSTLSFYEPMTVERIICELDPAEQAKFPQLTVEELEAALAILVEQRKVKRQKGERPAYQRIFPKRDGFFVRILKQLFAR